MLALDYLRRSRKTTPATEMKALEYINVGYQRLLTFEVAGGGFDWYGHAPANVVLSAYGLLEFQDMSKVYEIDGRILQRTRDWLFRQQQADGSWEVPPRTAWSWSGLSGKLVVTAYVAWSLGEAGYRGPELDRAAVWLKKNLSQAQDLYSRALAANALAVWNPKDKDLADLLAQIDDKKVVDAENRCCSWRQDGSTAFYAKGEYASVETTALVALAMMKTPDYANTVNQSLAYLARMKDARGTWGSTSATILALKAILRGMGAQEQKGTAKVKVSINGRSQDVSITPDQADVLHLVDLPGAAVQGRNKIEIEVEGESAAMYQVVGRYWLPWNEVAPEERSPLSVKVSYDNTSISKDDVLRAQVRMQYHGKAPTFMIVLDLGIPPGFVVDTSGFEKMVEKKTIDRFGATSRQITLYFGTIQPEQVVEFGYELRPKYPIRAKTPKTTAYEYYSPDRKGESRPVEIEVKD